MPWHITDEHPDCDGWAVVKNDDNELVGCHDTYAEAFARNCRLCMSVRMKGRVTAVR